MEYSKVKEVEAKIMKWLKEESLSPKRVEDPNAFFNYQVQYGGKYLHVYQNINFSDSITVTCVRNYTEEQVILLNERMDEHSKTDYFHKIKRDLTLHPYIWNYYIGEKQIIMHSKRLYYDNLTKDNLMHMIHLMVKMFYLPIMLIDDYFQEFWPEWTAEDKDNSELDKMR